MARVTIEDCKNHAPDRFQLVVVAKERAASINSGAEIMLKENNDKRHNKAPVTALREVAAGCVTVENLEQALIRRLRRKGDVVLTDSNVKSAEAEDVTDEDIDYMPSGQDLLITDDYSDLDSEKYSEIDDSDDIERTPL